MKRNKGYLVSSLAAQMILLPALLTAFLFGFFPLFLLFFSNTMGSDLTTLIFAAVLFVASLFLGLAVGYYFSRFSKSIPNSLREKNLVPLLPIFYALAFFLPAFLIAGNDFNSSWWILYVFKNPVFLVFDVFLIFAGLHFIIPVAELAAYLGFPLGILVHESRAGKLTGAREAASWRKGFALLAVFLLVVLGTASSDIISRGMVELLYGKPAAGGELTEFDLLQIAPFKDGNGLARLEGEASLCFEDFDAMPRLDGATAFYPVYASFVEAVYTGLGEYYSQHKDSPDWDYYAAFVASEKYPLDIVMCSKTGRAYDRLIQGEADIIFVLEPSRAHLEAVRAAGDEFKLTPIAWEAFVFFTNVRNPVENLTIKEIQDIYSGKITNWKEVGGRSSSILAFQRPENSGSQTTMLSQVMKDVPMMEPTRDTFAGGMGEIINQVASYRNARNSLGYSFMYYSSRMIQNMQIKYLSIEGIKPDQDSIRNQTYPFTVPIYAVTLATNKDENVRLFLEWVLSEEGQSLIEKTGYVSLH